MKRASVFFILITIGLFLFTTCGYAKTIKIGYIDVQKVLYKSKRGLEATKAFQAKGTEMNKVIRKKQDELKALKELLEKQATMLSEEVRKEKEREYQQKLKELERLVKDSRDELKRLEKEMLDELMKGLEKVVKKLGREKNYTLILEAKASYILYAPEEINLTDEVIKAFDAVQE